MKTHPIQDEVFKSKLVKKVQEAVLSKWPNDVTKMDKSVSFY